MISISTLLTNEEKFKIFKTQYKELENDLIYYSRDQTEHRIYIVAMDGEKVVGMISLLEESIRVRGALGITFVSVKHTYRDQGIATMMVTELFKFAKSRGQDITNTQYEKDGLLYLRPVLHRLAQATPEVTFYEYPYCIGQNSK